MNPLPKLVAYLERQTILHTLIIVVAVTVVLSASNIGATIQITEEPNWQAFVLSDAHVVTVRPDDGLHGQIIMSYHHHRVTLSHPNDAQPFWSIDRDVVIDSIYEAALGNFDDDTALEVAMLLENITCRSAVDTNVCMRVFVYDVEGSAGITPTASSSISLHAYYPQEYIASPSSGILRSNDSDRNGIDDMLVSVDFKGYYSGIGDEGNKGHSLYWRHFPNDTAWTSSKAIHEFAAIDDNTILIQSHEWQFSYWDILGRSSDYYEYDVVSLNNNFGESQAVPNSYMGQIGCSGDHVMFGHGSEKKQTVPLLWGDLTASNDGIEVIVRQTASLVCWNGSGGSAGAYRLLAIDSNLSVRTLVDQYDPQYFGVYKSFNAYSNFCATRPGLGDFLAKRNADGRIIAFDALTGASIDSSDTPIPDEFRGWTDAYGDGNRYILNTSGPSASLYRLDYTTAVDDGGDNATLPQQFEITAAYPNPFNPSVSLTIAVPSREHITVNVYDALGRKVAVAAERDFAAGQHKLTWDACGNASGVYFVRATTQAGVTRTRTVTLLK